MGARRGSRARPFGSVLAHEFSHSLVARARGVDVNEITLFIFGGAAKLRDEPRDAASEFLIAAAAPGSRSLWAPILFLASAVEAVASPASTRVCGGWA